MIIIIIIIKKQYKNTKNLVMPVYKFLFLKIFFKINKTNSIKDLRSNQYININSIQDVLLNCSFNEHFQYYSSTRTQPPRSFNSKNKFFYIIPIHKAYEAA